MAFNLAYSKYFKDFRIFYIEKEIILVTYKEVNFFKKIFNVRTYDLCHIYNLNA